MLFRTRYGTKATIKTYPIANSHIEPYILSPINMNCTLHDEQEDGLVRQLANLVEEVPDCLFDDWDNDFQFDPINEVTDIGLGTYCIHEEDTFIPNLTKECNDFNELWDIFFDGS